MYIFVLYRVVNLNNLNMIFHNCMLIASDLSFSNVFVCCFLIYIFFSGMRNVAAFHTRDYVTITRNVVLAIALYQVLEVIVVYMVPVVIVSRYEIAETILQLYYLKIAYLTLNIRYVFIKCIVSVF